MSYDDDDDDDDDDEVWLSNVSASRSDRKGVRAMAGRESEGT